MVKCSRQRQCGCCGQWLQLEQPLLHLHPCTLLLVIAQMLVDLIQAIQEDQKHIEDQLHQAQAHCPYLMKCRHGFSPSFSIIISPAYPCRNLDILQCSFQLATNSSVGIVSSAGVNSTIELTPVLELTLLWS